MAVSKRIALGIAATFWLAAVASPAAASNVPVDPLAGASFDTTELYTFEVQHGQDDPPWAIVLSPDDGKSGGMIFPSDDPQFYEVDMGWLAAKFNVLGRYTWSICDYDEAAVTIVDATCSPPRPFSITFRLSTLTGSDARSDARRVFKKMARFPPAGPVRCRRDSRTKRTCKVGTYLGDAFIYGRVVVWNKHPRGVRTYDLTRYRATLRIYNEYCHLVNNRPRSECDDPYKKRSGWTYDV